MINWKVVILTAIAGLVFSFLIGLISSVGFGSALLRAFGMGILSGGLCIGVFFLIDKFLPELKFSKNNSAETFGEKSDTLKQNLDIVLDNEETLNQEELQASALESFSDVSEDSDADSQVEMLSSADDSDLENTEDSSDYEEASEEQQEDYEQPQNSHNTLNNGEEMMQEEDAIDAEPVFNEADELPDLENYSGSFQTNYSSHSEIKKNSDAAVQKESPDIMAKAVQSMLKKDK